ncbi:MAG: hypothetical protein JXQ27_01810 [Acidobacteria bacterium]|nr:hypothetical protein [Acidobacteriota bacterium]
MKRAALILWSVCLVSAVLPAAEQEWYKYWDDAMKAKAEGRWGDVVENLRIAIRKEPEPKRNKKIHSNIRIDYFPYYWLAEAYYNQGKYEAAEEYIGLSESWKEILGDEDFRHKLADLKSAVGSARDRQAQARPTVPAPLDPEMQHKLAEGEERLRSGDLNGARHLWRQVQSDALARQDSTTAAEAERRLKELADDEQALSEAQRLFGAEKYDEALAELQKIKRLHGAAQEMRQRVSAASIEQKTERRVFRERLQEIQDLLSQKKYGQALALLRGIAERQGTQPEVGVLRQRLLGRMLEEAQTRLESGELEAADGLCRLLEDGGATVPAVSALRERIAAAQEWRQAQSLLNAKRYQQAKPLLYHLREDPRFGADAVQHLDDIRQAENRLAQRTGEIEQMITAQDFETAETALNALAQDYPGAGTIAGLQQSLRQGRAESGRLAVEEYLKEGLRLFFREGDYHKATFYFDTYLEKGTRRDLALFFRAMSQIYLQYLEGDKNSDFLEKARRDIAQISPSFEPPRRWIAGKALKKFDEWRGADQPADE